MLAINDTVVHLVAEFFPQGLQDDPEGVALVVRHEILHVFEHEGQGALGGDNARNVKEQGSLGGAFETVRPSQGVVLAYPGNTERLAWKAAEQHVMIGNLLCRKGHDVANKGVVVSKILGVGFLGVVVPFAGKHTLAAIGGKTGADAANASEKVDECKAGAVTGNGHRLLQQAAQCRPKHGGAGSFTFFPAPDGLDVLADMFGNYALGVAAAGLPEKFHLGSVFHFFSLGIFADMMTCQAPHVQGFIAAFPGGNIREVPRAGRVNQRGAEIPSLVAMVISSRDI